MATKDTAKTSARRPTAAKKTSRPEDTSLPARTARTIKERPYTSAAIATGAVAAVAAVAAGAVLVSRRDKSLRETGEDLATRVKGGLATASDKVRDLAERGTAMFAGDDSSTGSDGRTQREIAEEALTLKETGKKSGGPRGPISQQDIKAGMATAK